jgi:hypothetical protein
MTRKVAMGAASLWETSRLSSLAPAPVLMSATVPLKRDAWSASRIDREE